jgi:hypothetical protein
VFIKVTVIGKLLTLQHQLNPLHMYCRCLDRGLRRDFSAKACKCYELLIFMWMSYAIKTVIHVCCAVNRSCHVEKALRELQVRSESGR